MSGPDKNQGLRITAPAKINLFLHITGRRDDGFHLLESLFVFTRAGDVITIGAADGLVFSQCGQFSAGLDGGEDNLVVKAARVLAAAAGIDPAVSITLEKNLPVAAGIGGGSADAAATLLGLNEFWQLGWSNDRLEDVALRLGADVPACLHRSPLYVEGVGEHLTPVELGFTAGVLLVNPGKTLSTPAVFAAYRLANTPFDTSGAGAAKPWQSLCNVIQQTKNSLQAAAIGACADIQRVLDYLIAIPGVKLVRMSGSGATCFALFSDRAAAEAALAQGKKDKPEWWFMADEIAR
ncbi:4-(cytidine 5'-diphospho)-2-C-methyl-D-erythritol kinase [Kordiimonas sp.]|uniref:4-(cytidine 5'-diphospho)-2-C-methyl-D-erythritol kinase n=1 Tax=Kordiimonas sp. TaxID=1970157 RepID=UPI003A92586C